MAKKDVQVPVVAVSAAVEGDGGGVENQDPTKTGEALVEDGKPKPKRERKKAAVKPKAITKPRVVKVSCRAGSRLLFQ